MNGFCVIFITVDKKELGQKIAHALVAEKLAACVNLVDQVSSVYRWKGEIKETEEALLIGKTKVDYLEMINDRLKVLHPYEVFELIALPVVGGNDKYFRWLEKSLGS
jgi:periplasmic divalent cation tolerance protein